MKRWIAYKLRIWADRLDWEGAPKRTDSSFTYERGKGVVFNFDRRGCPLWYYGNQDHERAYNEAERPL